MNILEVTLKLLLAIALGGLIGLEGESNQKKTGFRTSILICVGAAMMMILSGLISQGSGNGNADLTRIAAGVIMGLGFIGAGTIIQARGSSNGLTTAVTLWTVGGLGLVIGAGFHLIAIIYTSIIILTLVIYRQFEEHYSKRTFYHYHVKIKHTADILINIKELALHEGVRIKEIRKEIDGKIANISISFSAQEEKEYKFNSGLLNLKGLVELKSD